MDGALLHLAPAHRGYPTSCHGSCLTKGYLLGHVSHSPSRTSTQRPSNLLISFGAMGHVSQRDIFFPLFFKNVSILTTDEALVLLTQHTEAIKPLAFMCHISLEDMHT